MITKRQPRKKQTEKNRVVESWFDDDKLWSEFDAKSNAFELSVRVVEGRGDACVRLQVCLDRWQRCLCRRRGSHRRFSWTDLIETTSRGSAPPLLQHSVPRGGQTLSPPPRERTPYSAPHGAGRGGYSLIVVVICRTQTGTQRSTQRTPYSAAHGKKRERGETHHALLEGDERRVLCQHLGC